MKADWIERCVNAACKSTGDVDTAIAERLKLELEAQLSMRGLRPRELTDLADQLMSLSSIALSKAEADPPDADQRDLS